MLDSRPLGFRIRKKLLVPASCQRRSRRPRLPKSTKGPANALIVGRTGFWRPTQAVARWAEAAAARVPRGARVTHTGDARVREKLKFRENYFFTLNAFYILILNLVLFIIRRGLYFWSFVSDKTVRSDEQEIIFRQPSSFEPW